MPAVVNKHPVDNNAQSNSTLRCCVCFVGVVDSTRITSAIDSPEKARKYYDIFITLGAIAREFGAKIIRNEVDCLVLYFPHISCEKSLRDVMECCITLIEAHDPINDKLRKEDLPILSYRISADYGSVELVLDGPEPYLFEQTARINSLAPPNGLIIGNDLHDLIQSVPLSSSLETYYHFEAIGSSEEYPVFSLRRNDRRNDLSSNVRKT
jgi:two-component system, OmpR family, response regulator ChvI